MMDTLLAGVTVLDISEYIAGPYCGSLLADLGARVIKVEPPDGAEERRLGNRERYRGNTRMALAYNRGKESLAVDLRKPEGREIVYKLVPRVDIVIQNFPPSVAQKLGIDYEALVGDQPELIFVRAPRSAKSARTRSAKASTSSRTPHRASCRTTPTKTGAQAPEDQLHRHLHRHVQRARRGQRAPHRDARAKARSRDLALRTGLALQAQNLIHVDELDARAPQELELLRTARRPARNTPQLVDEFAELRLREDMPRRRARSRCPTACTGRRSPGLSLLPRVSDRRRLPEHRRAQPRPAREALRRARDRRSAHRLDLGNTLGRGLLRAEGADGEIEERLLQQPNAHWVEASKPPASRADRSTTAPHLYDDPQVQALDMMWTLENEELGRYKTPGHPIRFSKTRRCRAGNTDARPAQRRRCSRGGYDDAQIAAHEERGDPTLSGLRPVRENAVHFGESGLRRAAPVCGEGARSPARRSRSRHDHRSAHDSEQQEP